MEEARAAVLMTRSKEDGCHIYNTCSLVVVVEVGSSDDAVAGAAFAVVATVAAFAVET